MALKVDDVINWIDLEISDCLTVEDQLTQEIKRISNLLNEAKAKRMRFQQASELLKPVVQVKDSESKR